jgi:hypothetical protein
LRIALVDTTPKKSKLISSLVYPLPLLKLGAWQKHRGNEVKLFHNELPPAGEYEEIWLTTLFTYDIPHALGIVKAAKDRCRRVWVGGVSATISPADFKKQDVDVWEGLLPEAEAHAPDYSLLGSVPDYSITHITRGCVRKCGFCYVRVIEPKYYRKKNWEKSVHPQTKHILFYDNNWLACKPDELKEDVIKIKHLIKTTENKTIDFNQALDARLLTEEKADIIAGLPYKPLRFAFDSMAYDGYTQLAIERMAKRGTNRFNVLMLYNYTDTPEDLYYRMREMVKMGDQIRNDCRGAIEIVPMRYHPVLGNRNFTGEHWTDRQKKGVAAILGAHSTHGQIACKKAPFDNGEQEFEFWFGKDAKEFVRLLNYPKLPALNMKKCGYVRMKRAALRRDRVGEIM